MSLLIPDVSHYQTFTDYNAAFGAVDGVIVKRTEGWNVVDPSGLAVANAARARGKLLGHYHYVGSSAAAANGTPPADPNTEADWFLSHTTDWRAGEILICDYEPRVAPADPDAWCAAFNARVRQMRGPTPMMYLNESQVNTMSWQRVVAMNSALWIARYYLDNGVQSGPDPKAGPWGQWSGWQYTSKGIGKVPGISGQGLDLSRFDLTPAAWQRIGGLGGQDDMPTAKEVAQEVWWNSFVTRTGADGKDVQVPVIQEIADIKTAMTDLVNRLASALGPPLADKVVAALNGKTGATPDEVKEALTSVLREGTAAQAP